MENNKSKTWWGGSPKTKDFAAVQSESPPLRPGLLDSCEQGLAGVDVLRSKVARSQATFRRVALSIGRDLLFDCRVG